MSLKEEPRGSCAQDWGTASAGQSHAMGQDNLGHKRRFPHLLGKSGEERSSSVLALALVVKGHSSSGGRENPIAMTDRPSEGKLISSWEPWRWVPLLPRLLPCH